MAVAAAGTETTEAAAMAARPEAAGLRDRVALAVQRSVQGRCWRETRADETSVRDICRQHDLPDLIGRILAARGIALDSVPDYLSPSLRAYLPDPDVLADGAKAASIVADAVQAGETIGVFGDYDVDGATSTALMVRYLRDAGARTVLHIPDRLEEGYGPNLPAVEAMAEKGASLFLFLDCGTTAFDVLKAVGERGLPAVVVDHHTAEARLPDVRAVVNPNRQDDTSGLGDLAACGVTFLLLVGINRRLRTAGHFGEQCREPSLLGLLDLVALGTICDVVPLTGLNRAFVAQGLKVINARSNSGLAALARVAGLEGALDGYHAGFILGPRINAGGRVGRADLGARLLSGDLDGEDVDSIAGLLDTHNEDRKARERAVLDDAAAHVVCDSGGTPVCPVVTVHGNGWHPGVIGIVAGRLKEKFARPVCVISWQLGPDGAPAGVGKASARSVPGIDLGRAVIDARNAGLLLAGGGHAMAAGFSIERRALDAFQAFMDDHVRRQIADAFPGTDSPDDSPLARDYRIDSILAAEAATVGTAHLVARLGPFGPGNPEPRFVIPSVRLIKPRVVGAGHVSFFASGGGGASLKAIAFRAADGPLGAVLMGGGRDRPVHIAGTLRIDRWQGRETVQILVEDAAHADAT
ncbi:single-stranded-DNA-specific exonuclease RecJ [Fodinicurvata sp. EGI_FJ10296]|uniref:single-stranded-DNA-specific exonuclease RecJ n=1 Tax=Fodinicurvata sp. EGI_FJ10296 TaxID=3231908 RepID=UPI0034560F39